MPERTIPVHIFGYSATPSVALARVREYNGRERLGRAARASGACWAITLLGALIPLAHLVIVPGGLLFGGYLFWARFRAAIVPVECDGECPDCGTGQSFDLGSRWEMPADVSCDSCSRGLSIRTVGTGGGAGEPLPPRVDDVSA